MSHVFNLLPSFLREIMRFTVTPTTGGIVLNSGHTGRAFNLEHHDKQKLVNATGCLQMPFKHGLRLNRHRKVSRLLLPSRRVHTVQSMNRLQTSSWVRPRTKLLRSQTSLNTASLWK